MLCSLINTHAVRNKDSGQTILRQGHGVQFLLHIADEQILRAVFVHQGNSPERILKDVPDITPLRSRITHATSPSRLMFDPADNRRESGHRRNTAVVRV